MTSRPLFQPGDCKSRQNSLSNGPLIWALVLSHPEYGDLLIPGSPRSELFLLHLEDRPQCCYIFLSLCIDNITPYTFRIPPLIHCVLPLNALTHLMLRSLFPNLSFMASDMLLSVCGTVSLSSSAHLWLSNTSLKSTSATSPSCLSLFIRPLHTLPGSLS